MPDALPTPLEPPSWQQMFSRKVSLHVALHSCIVPPSALKYQWNILTTLLPPYNPSRSIPTPKFNSTPCHYLLSPYIIYEDVFTYYISELFPSSVTTCAQYGFQQTFIAIHFLPEFYNLTPSTHSASLMFSCLGGHSTQVLIPLDIFPSNRLWSIHYV